MLKMEESFFRMAEEISNEESIDCHQPHAAATTNEKQKQQQQQEVVIDILRKSKCIEHQIHRRVIRKVPLLLRRDEWNRGAYDPQFISIGPYHHGKPALRMAESLKPLVVRHLFPVDEDISYLYTKILGMVSKLRRCYDEGSMDKFSDEAFAQMMLLDSCVIIAMLESLDNERTSRGSRKVMEDFGILLPANTFEACFLLENQLPFRVLKLVMSRLLKHVPRDDDDDDNDDVGDDVGDDDDDDDVDDNDDVGDDDDDDVDVDVDKAIKEICVRLDYFPFFALNMQRDDQKKHIIHREKKKPSIHLLEFFHREMQLRPPSAPKCPPIMVMASPFPRRSCILYFRNILLLKIMRGRVEKKKKKENLLDFKDAVVHPRSVTELKTKGIHFKQSNSRFFGDIKFRSYFFYGMLEIPPFIIGRKSLLLISNLMAYEQIRYERISVDFSSYVTFLKALIIHPNDVKELRSKGILNSFGLSDEDIAKIFLRMHSREMVDSMIYKEEWKSIEKHYNSKMRTWVAELINNYFSSPWTLIAFVAATAALALTIAQTYFAIHPRSSAQNSN